MERRALDVEPGLFDAVISRVGLIYFPDRATALPAYRSRVRPGGRLAAAVYSTPAANAFFSIPVSVIRSAPGWVRHHRSSGPVLPGQPGVASRPCASRFPRLVAVRLDAPLRMASAADCLRFEQESFGGPAQMLADSTKKAGPPPGPRSPSGLQAF